MSQSPIILLLGANNNDKPLSQLSKEISEIHNTLRDCHDQRYIQIERQDSTTPNDLSNLILRYEKRIIFIHYCGHADEGSLLLEDEKGDGKTTYAKGIAGLLGKLPNLQGVFLNGCATKGQVNELLQQGVKTVIATASPIGDTKARTVSKWFYKALVKDKTLETAYAFTKKNFEKDYPIAKLLPIASTRSAFLSEEEEEEDENFKWGLYWKEKEDLTWKLPTEKPLHIDTKTYNTIPFIAMDQIIGRQTTLTTIHQHLNTNQRPVLLVNGIGGIGKTAVAKAYITHYQAHYDHLIWLTHTGKETDSLPQTFVNDAALLQNLGLQQAINGLPKERFIKSAYQLILNRLQQTKGKNLLVLDNINDKNTLQDYAANLQSIGWKTIVTSRAKAADYHEIPIDELPMQEAKALFYRFYKREKEDTLVEAILQNIDRHTLLTELIAKAGQKAKLSLTALAAKIEAEYISDKALQKRRIDTGESGKSLEDRPKQDRILHYIQYIFSDIADLNDLEKTYLRYFAILPLQDHEEDFIKSIFKIEEDNEYDFYDTLEELVEKGWLIENDELYRLHPLIQEVIVGKLTLTTENCLPVIESVTELIHIDDAKDNPIDKFSLVQYGWVVLNQVNKKSLFIAKVLDSLGYIYQHIGNYNEAVKLKKEALNIAFLEGSNEIIAEYQSNLGVVYRYMGMYKEAVNLLEASLNYDIIRFGKNHPKIAIRQSNLGIVYKNLGDYEKAAKLHEIALDINIKNFNKNHPEIATNQSNLGVTYRYLGRYEEAANLIETSLKFNISKFGMEHPNVIGGQSNLALVYQNLGKFEEAAHLLEIVLNSAIKNLGIYHPNIAIFQTNLAIVYSDLRNYDGAVALLETALQSDIDNLGANHPNVAKDFGILGKMYFDLKKYEKAKTAWLECDRILKLNFGNNHPYIEKNKKNLEMIDSYIK